MPPRTLVLPPDATDAEIAEALSALPLARLEAVTRLLLARMDANARSRLLGAAAALPRAVGDAAERAVHGLVASAFRPRTSR